MCDSISGNREFLLEFNLAVHQKDIFLGKKVFFNIFDFNKKYKNEMKDNNEKICNRCSQTGYAHLVRPLDRLLIFNVWRTRAELRAGPYQRVDLIAKFSTSIFKFNLKL